MSEKPRATAFSTIDAYKVRSVEALPGLSDRGFEESEIPYADSSAGNGSDTFVENQDFAQREVSGHARRR